MAHWNEGGITTVTDAVKQIRRATRRRFSGDEKIRVVSDGLRVDGPVSELYRREEIQTSIYSNGRRPFWRQVRTA